MRKFKVKVKGVTPYMQHRMDDASLQDWEKRRGTILERDNLQHEPERRAAFPAYINQEGEYFIPAEHFKQSFIKGGAFVKAKVGNSKKSMKNIVAGMWRISEQEIRIAKFDEVDTRSAVNKNVKARIIVHRPKWNKWKAEFTLLIDDDARNGVTHETIESIIGYSGRYLGIGSYRPEHTGEFGRFEVDKIVEL